MLLVLWMKQWNQQSKFGKRKATILLVAEISLLIGSSRYLCFLGILPDPRARTPSGPRTMQIVRRTESAKLQFLRFFKPVAGKKTSAPISAQRIQMYPITYGNMFTKAINRPNRTNPTIFNVCIYDLLKFTSILLQDIGDLSMLSIALFDLVVKTFCTCYFRANSLNNFRLTRDIWF